MITLQSIFNAAWQKFIVEDGEPASETVINNRGCVWHSCKYLTKDGKKCVVGLMLPDGHESQKATCDFSRLVELYPELFDDDVKNTTPAMLLDFQFSLHDTLQCKGKWTLNKEDMKQEYIRVAKVYNLTVPDHSE